MLAKAQNVTAAGQDVICSSWTDVRRAPLSWKPMSDMELESSLSAEMWALGFLSGFAVVTAKDKLRGVNPSEVWSFIDFQCILHPTETIGDLLLNWWNARH
jgi:hypothetical protein